MLTSWESVAPLNTESPPLQTVSPSPVENSVLQDCIAEAKLLVDSAYNRTQKRWARDWEGG